jgi:hypothetical protein
MQESNLSLHSSMQECSYIGTNVDPFQDSETTRQDRLRTRSELYMGVLNYLDHKQNLNGVSHDLLGTTHGIQVQFDLKHYCYVLLEEKEKLLPLLRSEVNPSKLQSMKA